MWHICPKCDTDRTIASQPSWLPDEDAAESIVTCEMCKHEWNVRLEIVAT